MRLGKPYLQTMKMDENNTTKYNSLSKTKPELLFFFDCTPCKTYIGGPKKADHVTKWHTDVDG